MFDGFYGAAHNAWLSSHPLLPEKMTLIVHDICINVNFVINRCICHIIPKEKARFRPPAISSKYGCILVNFKNI
ncbi:unnamed protein product [Candida parapsilosis]